MDENRHPQAETPTHFVAKNGKRMYGSIGTLQEVISLVRLLESSIDRVKQHSPYTIGVIFER